MVPGLTRSARSGRGDRGFSMATEAAIRILDRLPLTAPARVTRPAADFEQHIRNLGTRATDEDEELVRACGEIAGRCQGDSPR